MQTLTTAFQLPTVFSHLSRIQYSNTLYRFVAAAVDGTIQDCVSASAMFTQKQNRLSMHFSASRSLAKWSVVVLHHGDGCGDTRRVDESVEERLISALKVDAWREYVNGKSQSSRGQSTSAGGTSCERKKPVPGVWWVRINRFVCWFLVRVPGFAAVSVDVPNRREKSSRGKPLVTLDLWFQIPVYSDKDVYQVTTMKTLPSPQSPAERIEGA